jgi:hypothetical protein
MFRFRETVGAINRRPSLRLAWGGRQSGTFELSALAFQAQALPPTVGRPMRAGSGLLLRNNEIAHGRDQPLRKVGSSRFDAATNPEASRR